MARGLTPGKGMGPVTYAGGGTDVFSGGRAVMLRTTQKKRKKQQFRKLLWQQNKKKNKKNDFRDSNSLHRSSTLQTYYRVNINDYTTANNDGQHG